MDMPVQIAQIPNLDRHLSVPGPNTYKSGLKDIDKAEANYGPPSSDNPILIIVNPIFDIDSNIILPGHYELSLSDDKKILRITQSQKLIATIPVFKYKDNRSQDELKQTMDKKTLKKLEKKKKKEEKQRKKDFKAGKFLTIPQVYNNASLEFDKKEGFYLIKYERDKIEAWGILKTRY